MKSNNFKSVLNKFLSTFIFNSHFLEPDAIIAQKFYNILGG